MSEQRYRTAHVELYRDGTLWWPWHWKLTGFGNGTEGGLAMTRSSALRQARRAARRANRVRRESTVVYIPGP